MYFSIFIIISASFYVRRIKGVRIYYSLDVIVKKKKEFIKYYIEIITIWQVKHTKVYKT